MPPADPSLDSPYSPPRAGRGAARWRLWFALLRRTRLHELATHPFAAALRAIALFGGATVGSVAIPTLGYFLLPNPLWRRIGPPLFFVAFLVALGEFTRPSGDLALGLAAAVHGVGAAACSSCYVPLPSRPLRILHRFIVALVSVLLVLLATQNALSRHVLLVDGPKGPLLFDPRAPAAAPPRDGEAVAYNLDSRNLGNAAIWGGVYTGRVLVAAPGREIVFSDGLYRVDGSAYKALPGMPARGGFRTDADHAFIWPDPSHFRHPGRVAVPADIGLVPHSALVGRPYKRWFWRKQTP